MRLFVGTEGHRTDDSVRQCEQCVVEREESRGEAAGAIDERYQILTEAADAPVLK